MKLAIIGDFRKENATHRATNAAIGHSMDQLNSGMAADWIATSGIIHRFDEIAADYQGFLISPGSPYDSMEGVLKIIRYGRENNIPVLGTCGGFQHMVIEFARNVLEIGDAEHAETNPSASNLIINPLQCSLVGQSLDILITAKSSIAYALYRRETVTESYYCTFGLNPEYQSAVHDRGFQVVASDANGEARILELEEHPFFVGTLFVPQTRSTVEAPHPLHLQNPVAPYSKPRRSLLL